MRRSVDIHRASRQNPTVPSHHHLSKGTLIWSIIALWSLIPGAIGAQLDSTYRDQKQRLADLHVRPLIDTWLERSGGPGGVVALVDRDQVLILQGFGLSDTSRRSPVDPNTTLFQVGELVRSMTATAVLRLAERGLLSLDDDLSRRHDMQFVEVGPFGAFTLEQLLLHTAGFDHRVIASRTDSVDRIQPLARYLQRRMPPRVRPSGQISTPSTHGYSLAGLLVERATSMTFEDSLDELVFAPFEMSHTTVDPSSLLAADLAAGYRRHHEQLSDVVADYPQTIPASFLLTTAADMARWLQIILTDGSLDGQHLLGSESINRLLTPQFAHHASLPGRTLAFKEGPRFSPPELYLAARGHGFSSALLLLPHRRVGLFAAFNSELDFWGLVYPILDTFEPRRSDPITAKPVSPVMTAEHLTGYWQDAAVSKMTAEKLLAFVRQDRLVGLDDGSLSWRSRKYEPISPVEFREQDGDRWIRLLESSTPSLLAATEDRVIEKLDWYASRPIQASLWIFFATAFLITGWPRPPLPQRESSLTPTDTFSPRWPMTIARLAATLHFLFIVALAIMLASALRWKTPTLLYEISPVVYGVLVLPLLGGALTLVAIVGVGFAWRSPNWIRRQQLLLTLSTLVLALFLLFLRDWNLLGFHI